jgi:hypothetical protein
MISLDAYAGLGMSPVELAARYRAHARQCFTIAQKLEGREKLALLDMAQAWLGLGAQAEKNEALVFVYETPEPRPPADRQRQQIQAGDPRSA